MTHDPLSSRPSAASIVSAAAAILQQEVQSLAAAAPIARVARELGESALSAQLPQDLSGPVRDLVDALVRVVGNRPDWLAQLIRQPDIASGAGRALDGGRVLLLRAAHEVSPGDIAHISLRLENDDSEADECILCATDLAGAPGYRIPAAHVRAIPQPVRVPGAGSAEVQIEVRVPSDTPPGLYTGLVQVDDGESLRALVQVIVRQ